MRNGPIAVRNMVMWFLCRGPGCWCSVEVFAAVYYKAREFYKPSLMGHSCRSLAEENAKRNMGMGIWFMRTQRRAKTLLGAVLDYMLYILEENLVHFLPCPENLGEAGFQSNWLISVMAFMLLRAIVHKPLSRSVVAKSSTGNRKMSIMCSLSRERIWKKVKAAANLHAEKEAVISALLCGSRKSTFSIRCMSHQKCQSVQRQPHWKGENINSECLRIVLLPESNWICS